MVEFEITLHGWKTGENGDMEMTESNSDDAESWCVHVVKRDDSVDLMEPLFDDDFETFELAESAFEEMVKMYPNASTEIY